MILDPSSDRAFGGSSLGPEGKDGRDLSVYHGDRGDADGLEAVGAPGGAGTIKHLPPSL